MANHDPLTGLPNRRLFQIRFEEAIASARQNGTSVTLLMIDLDNFKDINDTIGHDAGDRLLKAVAACLTTMARPCDTVARLGGDEFAFLVTKPLRLEDAIRFAHLVVERLRQPFEYEGRTLSGYASIGLAAFPDHDVDPAELVQDADIALYRAKAEGRNRAVIYAPEMRRSTEQRVALGREVREALSEGRIIPYYQPKLCLTTGRVMGLEALARWRHSSQRVLTPEAFGIVFDDPEIAAAICRQMMTAVASNMRDWIKGGLNFGRVAVNLSSAEFSQPDLAQSILNILEQHEVPPESFEVEVTETVLLGRSLDVVRATLQQFHEQDVLIALDDFGTGYASLTHLKQFPVGRIKIDRSFVMNLERDAGDKAIVAAIIGLGRNLGMQITAEGVETLGQAQRLRDLGCHNAQGYLYSRPIEGEQVSCFLQALETANAF